MPTPGSHTYDLQRSRLRRRAETEGVPDDRAEERATRLMRKREGDVSSAMTTDRAAGPTGERGGGGDPGAVVDLRSPAFSDNTMMPARHTRTDDNLSPPLEWSAPPEATEELVVWCEDRDAPDGGLVHWLVTGIQPSTTSLEEASALSGATVRPNSFGNSRYDGPLPPLGDEPHRYFFQVFALGDRLDLPADAPIDDVRRAVDELRLATGTLIGLFAR
jgi:Raf kinase inhibitor-like YbhB/YbcL family protein